MVGSGPGGAMVAWALAEQGHEVIVVESGPRLRAEDFVQDLGKTLASWFWDGGVRTTRGNVAFPTMQVRALGGGTVFNSGICMRILPSVLEEWQDAYGLSELTVEALAPHYEAVETFLGIGPADEKVWGRRNELFREACDKLGWSWEPTQRFERGCVGSGECITGCRHGAKTSVDRRGIPEVAQAGGRVYASVHIDRLIVEHGVVRGVVGTTTDPERNRRYPVRLRAPTVILAAGAIGSPQIMRRSGLNRSVVGSRLRFHPSCYLVGLFDERVDPWHGATQGVHSSHHLDRGIKLEALWATASTFSRSLPRRPKAFQRYLKKWPNMAVWDAWISGNASVGKVRNLPGGKADIQWRMAEPDVNRLREANALLCDMFAAAGAREVFTGIRGLPEAMEPGEAAVEIRSRSFDATELPTASNHVFGGSPMGADPEDSVCDGWGRVWDVEGLYVSDTGLYPSSPGVNPQLTAMALAHRLGTFLA